MHRSAFVWFAHGVEQYYVHGKALRLCCCLVGSAQQFSGDFFNKSLCLGYMLHEVETLITHRITEIPEHAQTICANASSAGQRTNMLLAILQLGYAILAYVERQQELRRFAAALYEQLQHAQLPGVNA